MGSLKELVDYGVIGLLILLSVVAVAIAIERYRFYKVVNPDDYDTSQRLEAALFKRVHMIATIGSNAPYIGLLGTVLGIMQTFYTMGQDKSADVSAIMTGLALALKSTAAGLVTAIPAIVLYNALSRRAEVILLNKEADNASKEI